MRVLILFFLWPAWLFGQGVEPKLHPSQIGQFGATTGQSLIFDGTVYTPQNAGDIFGSGTGDQLAIFSTTPKNILGSSRFYVSTASQAGLYINGGDGSGNHGSFIQFRKDNVPNFIFGAESSLFGGVGTGGAIFQYGDNPFFFCTNSTKQMVITGNGRVGIGTVNPTQKMEVIGTVKASQILSTSNIGIGTDSPTQSLDVIGGVKATRFITDEAGSHSYYESRRGGIRDFEISNVNGDYWHYDGTKYSFFIQKNTGNVGINTGGNAVRPLHVNGAVRITGNAGGGGFVMLRDGNGDVSNATLGPGLNISSGVLSNTLASTAFLQGGNSFASAGVLGTNDANTMRVKANTYGLTINNTGYIQLDDTPTGPPSTPPAGSIFYSSNSKSLFFQEDAGAANTFKVLTEKPVNALLLLTANSTPGGQNFNIRCDANAGAFTITLGASLQEGRPYLVRCTRNSTNAITFTAASGYTLGIDTDTALNPTTLVSGAGGSGIAAPARIYLIQRIGTVINIK